VRIGFFSVWVEDSGRVLRILQCVCVCVCVCVEREREREREREGRGPQQPNSGLGRLTPEVPRSLTIRHIQPVGLPWTGDQPVTETTTYTVHSKQKRRTSMPPTGFERTIPAIERLQTYALDRTVTGIGKLQLILELCKNEECSHYLSDCLQTPKDCPLWM